MKPWEAAYDDWAGGMKLKDIAEKHGVTVSAVKSWVSRHFKPKQEAETAQKVATKKKRKLQPKGGESQPDKPRKAGAPKGNKNAVGNNGGAPLRNQNNFQHGLYAGVYWDTLDADEITMLEEMRTDSAEDMLLQQIALLTVRERRLMIQIKKYSDPKLKGQALNYVHRSEDKREFVGDTVEEDEKLYDERVQNEIMAGKRMPGHRYNLSTVTKGTYEIIQKFEAELTKVQGKKTRCIEALSKLRETQSSGGSESGEDSVVIYIPDNGRGDRK